MAPRILAALLALLLGLGQPVWAGPAARAMGRAVPSGTGMSASGAAPLSLPAPALSPAALTPAALTPAALTPSLAAPASPSLAPSAEAPAQAPRAAAQLDAAARPAPAPARSADAEAAESSRRWDAAEPSKAGRGDVAAAPADGPAPSGLGPSLPAAPSARSGVPAPRVALARAAEVAAWTGLTALSALAHAPFDRLGPLIVSIVLGLAGGAMATFWIAAAAQDPGRGRGEAPKERPVDQDEVNAASWRVGRFAKEAGLPAPSRFSIFPVDTVNAQAGGGGRGNYEVNLSAGVLDLPRGARDAVIRHELAHVKHADTHWTVGGYLLSALPATVALMSGVVDDWRAYLALPIAVGTLALIGASRKQAEYHADQYAAHKDGTPAHMIAALRAIEAQDAASRPNAPKTRWHAAARRADSAWQRVSRLWASHPPTAKRIERLETLAR